MILEQNLCPETVSFMTGVAVPFYSSAASIRRTKVMKLTDPELSFEHEGSSSLIGQFDFSGP